MFAMNDFTFPDTENEPMTYRNQAAPTVVPWFAYTVGSLIAAASVCLIVEVVRFEMLMNDFRNREKPSINWQQDIKPSLKH